MVFVIAECGVNWRDLVDADQMIKAAAEAGADAVKFQCYEKFDEGGKYLIGCPEDQRLVIESPAHPRAAELNAIRLNESTIRYLYWRCQQHGIELMVTPMYPEAVAMLDPYVRLWKIRHADQHNLELINKIAETGKDVLISTSDPPKYPDKEGHIKYLYCDPRYPPDCQTPSPLKGFDGYSCHIPSDKKAGWIVFRDALEYLEVHVRLDHYEPPHYCPIDTAVSITMSELAELCRRLKQ